MQPVRRRSVSSASSCIAPRDSQTSTQYSYSGREGFSQDVSARASPASLPPDTYFFKALKLAELFDNNNSLAHRQPLFDASKKVPGFKVPRFQGSKVSRFQDLKVSKVLLYLRVRPPRRLGHRSLR